MKKGGGGLPSGAIASKINEDSCCDSNLPAARLGRRPGSRVDHGRRMAQRGQTWQIQHEVSRASSVCAAGRYGAISHFREPLHFCAFTLLQGIVVVSASRRGACAILVVPVSMVTDAGRRTGLGVGSLVDRRLAGRTARTVLRRIFRPHLGTTGRECRCRNTISMLKAWAFGKCDVHRMRGYAADEGRELPTRQRPWCDRRYCQPSPLGRKRPRH